MRRCYFMLGVLLLNIFLSGCNNPQSEDISEIKHNPTQTTCDNLENENENQSANQFRKGYDLSVDQREQEQAEKEITDVFKILEKQYFPYWNEDSDEFEVPENIMDSMVNKLAKEGYIVKADGTYLNIRNEDVIEQFLENAKKGIEGEVILYVLKARGAVVRYKYSYDGSDMFVLTSGMALKVNGDYAEKYCTYTRLKSWRYTDAGWFCYELCVPEYPEVTEMVDGSVLIRVRPISEECRAASEKYVFGLGYQGNNILCSNWNLDSLDKLDYTGMYEYLYAMDKGERFALPEGKEEIPADEFESLIMKYIPVTKEMIRRYAFFDEANQAYYWDRLGCMNYAPTFFDTSYPEVVEINDNMDGTITLTVNAVCEMVLNDEAVITHDLTIKTNEDGSFQYLGNTILDNGIEQIPPYQHRITNELKK